MRRRLTTTLACLAACSRPTIGDSGPEAYGDDRMSDEDPGDDGDHAASDDDGLPPCEGPYCADPANCGAPGVQCPTTFSNPGDCHRGLCATASICLSERYDPPPGLTCDTACTLIDNEGTRCLERGCQGHTAYRFPDIVTCDGLLDELTPLDFACDDPIPFESLGGLSLRCCCVTP